MSIHSNTTGVSYVSPTGNSYVNALIGGTKWGGVAGTGVPLTYSFVTWSSSFEYGYGQGEPDQGSPLTAIEQSAVRDILSEVAAATGLTFRETYDSFNSAGELRFGRTFAVDPGAYAHAYFPNPSAEAGDVWLASWFLAPASLRPGDFGWFALVHEIGHALGLKHPFEGWWRLPGSDDHQLTTVMSYTEVPGAPRAAGFLPLDLLALQTLYGANTRAATGNDTYQPMTFAGLRTIWDAGGLDTLSFGGSSRDENFSLAQGVVQLSASAAFAIAWNTVIEHAAGGAGHDRIRGNDAANTLSGNAGNDLLEGLAGDDVLLGGAGDDWLVGGFGVNRLEGGPGFDIADYGGARRGMQRNPDGNVTVQGGDTLVGVERVLMGDRRVSLTDPLQRDLNGDLREDLVFLRPDGRAEAVLSVPSYPGLASPGSGWKLIGTGDFRGDGSAELLWRGADASLRLTDWASGSVATSFYNPDSSWTPRAVADFSGDGFADVLWQNGAGQTWIWVTRGGQIVAQGGPGHPGAGWQLLGAADIDGNARADLLWRNAAGVVWSWSIDGTARLSDAPVGLIGAGWSLRGMGDLDGDARSDLVWQNGAGQAWAWLVDGPGKVRNGAIGSAVPGWQIEAVQDGNGDALADLVFRKAGTGIYWQWTMNGTAVTGGGQVAAVAADWTLLA